MGAKSGPGRGGTTYRCDFHLSQTEATFFNSSRFLPSDEVSVKFIDKYSRYFTTCRTERSRLFMSGSGNSVPVGPGR